MFCPGDRPIDRSEIVSYIANSRDGPKATGHVIISGKMTIIRNGMFEGNHNITSITIAGSIKAIGDNAFKGCKNLKTVVIAEGPEEIGNEVFSGCSSLTSITLPDSIKICKPNAFKNTALDSPVLNASRTVLYFFPDTGSYRNIVLPKTVKVIYSFAFNQHSMFSIHLQEGLEEIFENAFYECCNLTDITIPFSTRIIKANAFYCCIHLERITVLGRTTEIEKAAFNLYSKKRVEFNIDIIDSDLKFSYLNMTFLTRNSNDVGNLNHVSSPEFISLTKAIEKGHTDAMYELSIYFKVLSKLPEASPFYRRASNYWMFNAYKKGNSNARDFIRWFFLIHPDEHLGSILCEDETITSYSYSLSARLLYELGYRFFERFDPSSMWEVKFDEKERIVEASTFSFQKHIVREYVPDYYYDWWFLDEFFRPIPTVPKCTSTFLDKDKGVVSRRRKLAIDYVKKMQA